MRPRNSSASAGRVLVGARATVMADSVQFSGLWRAGGVNPPVACPIPAVYRGVHIPRSPHSRGHPSLALVFLDEFVVLLVLLREELRRLVSEFLRAPLLERQYLAGVC